MTSAGLMIAFFLFTLAAVGAAGYAFVLKPGRTNSGAEIPVPLALNQPDMPSAQAAVVDIFRMMGEALPGRAAQTEATRRVLIAAGYRWPSAVSIFLGIKVATALMLAATGAWFAVTFGDRISTALIP